MILRDGIALLRLAPERLDAHRVHGQRCQPAHLHDDTTSTGTYAPTAPWTGGAQTWAMFAAAFYGSPSSGIPVPFWAI